MFKIHINDGQNTLPDDDIFYVVAKDGIYIKKTLGVMDSLVPVKNISTLEDIESTARMNIKKIPGGQFAQIIAFFKEVYKEYKAECIVILFYNEESKTYRVVPPMQKVSSAAIAYDRGMVLDGWLMVGDIHSHAAMSAFHSGTDHDDEQSFDGLHITLGNLGDNDISVSASIVSNGHRIIVEPEDYVNRLIKTKDIDEAEVKPNRVVWVYCHEKKRLIQDPIASSRFGTTTYRRLDKRYTVEVSKKYFKAPKGWMDMVENRGYIYSGKHVHAHYQRNQHNIDNWGSSWGYNYNSSLWGERGNKQIPKLLNAPEGTKPNADDNEDVIPCMSCKFKEYKILLETNEVEENEYYNCAKCDSIWEESALIDGDKCPLCDTGDFLFSYEKKIELQNEYIPSDEHDYLFVKDDPIEVKSDFIKCTQCGEVFHLQSGETKCPFCYTILGPRDVQEKDKENHMRSDSGEFLGKNTEEINKAAQQEINASESIVEKIPDPSDNHLPLPETQSSPFPSVKAMLDRVFGKRG